DVELHRGLASVAHRPRAHIDSELPRVAPSADALCDALGPRVVLGEVEVLAAARAGAAFLSRWRGLTLEAGEALDDVAKEARLALLAVGDDVDAGVGLPAYDIGHRLTHQPGIGVVVVRLPAVLRGQDRDERVEPCEAADVGGENP